MKFKTYDSWSGVEYPEKDFKANKPSLIIVHHTYIPRASAVGDKTVRNIQDYHINTQKWSDIGYHYVIDSEGVVYEGRKEEHNGAHTYGYNQKSIGVCCIGNYDIGYDIPSQEMQKAAIGLLDDIRRGYQLSRGSVFGHCDFSDKSCPGYYLYMLVNNYRRI